MPINWPEFKPFAEPVRLTLCMSCAKAGARAAYERGLEALERSGGLLGILLDESNYVDSMLFDHIPQ